MSSISTGANARTEKYSQESGWILPNPCSEKFMDCEGDCSDCPNKNYWDWCPECGPEDGGKWKCGHVDGTDW